MENARARAAMLATGAMLAAAVLTVAAVLFAPGLAAAQKQAGYYYPPPESSEVYRARAQRFADGDRRRRLGFVNIFTARMLENPYPPPFAIFAKGSDAQKMIIVSLQEGSYNTLYRMRGLLAILTSQARGTPFFREMAVDDLFTFFDLAYMLGFETITVSDGASFAHRIDLAE